MAFFLVFYMLVFGRDACMIGVTLTMAGLKNLKNDLTAKPFLSFIRMLIILLLLGLSAYLNNPLTIGSCIISFIVIFVTVFGNYKLFESDIYVPLLLCYVMMMGRPISFEELPLRLLSLIFGAFFIVLINVIVNKKRNSKFSNITLDLFVNELIDAIDSKLDGKEVSKDNFIESDEFYRNIFDRFAYKYFPTKYQQAVLDVVKAFQYIGHVIADYDLDESELKYIKSLLLDIHEINPHDIIKDIDSKSWEMSLVLMNLEIIAHTLKNKDSSSNKHIFPDRESIRLLSKPLFNVVGWFESVKFNFAMKMAVSMTFWLVLTLVFNLTFTKWLLFPTIAMMVPYVDDLKNRAKEQINGTIIGISIFLVIMIVIHHIPSHSSIITTLTILVFLIVLSFNSANKLITAIASTIISVMMALTYVDLPNAIEHKIAWVLVGVVVVSIFNYKFLPYSLELKTVDNLKSCHKLNTIGINLIKGESLGKNVNRRTVLVVISNLIHQNIEKSRDNIRLCELECKITDYINFILNYLSIHKASAELTDNIIRIIDERELVHSNLVAEDKITSDTLQHMMKLFDEEKELVKQL